jgi:hypothetical protein
MRFEHRQRGEKVRKDQKNFKRLVIRTVLPASLDSAESKTKSLFGVKPPGGPRFGGLD